MVLAERHARERQARIEVAIAQLLPGWPLAPVVEALQALCGTHLVTAATIMVEAGDLGRFETARQFMGYLGLVPGKRSTGTTVRALGLPGLTLHPPPPRCGPDVPVIKGG